MQITLNGEQVTLKLRKYINNRLALVSFDLDGIPYGTLTVNLVDETIEEDEAFLDTNNIPEVEEALIAAGLIEQPIRDAQSGYCIYPLYKINLEKFN